MTSDPATTPETRRIVDEMQEEARRRVGTGEVPEELVDHLDRHFHHIVQTDRGRRADAVRIYAAQLRAAAGFHVPEVDRKSRVPGGSLIHRVVGQTVRRHLEALLGQLQTFGEAAASLMDAEVEALAELRSHVEAVSERFAALEGLPDDARAALADVAARVRALETALSGEPGQRAG